MAVRKLWPDDQKSFGRISFTLGFVFSMMLTLGAGVLMFLVQMVFLVLT